MLARVFSRSLRATSLHKSFNRNILQRSVTTLQNLSLRNNVDGRRKYGRHFGSVANDTFNNVATSQAQIISASDVCLQEVDNQDSQFLRVVWNDGTTSRFPYIFLREVCKCPQCLDPSTKEKQVDIFEHGLANVNAVKAEISADALELRCVWSDNGHKSVYPSAWLYDRRLPEQKSPPASNEIVHKDLVCWDKSTMQDKIPEFDYTAVMNDDQTLFDCLYALYRYGIMLINDAPTTVGVSESYAARIGYMQTTHYGGVFEVQTKADPSNLAYTSGYLPFHCDLPFITCTPEVQVFHCIEQAPENAGGENIFVDLFTVAKKLMEIEPVAFDILSKTSVLYHDVGTDAYGEFYYCASSKFFCLNDYNRLQRVKMNSRMRKDRWNNFTPEEIAEYYKKYLLFVEMMYEPENVIQHRLKPGQIVSFQNTRVFHGRAEITDARSARWLRGHYHQWDTIFSKLRVLHAKLGLKSPHLYADTNDFF